MTYSPNTHRIHNLFSTFSKTDHILGHKAIINKYKKTEITCYILCNHNGIKPKVNKKVSTENIQIHED
jgi:hypothetical protein